MTDFDAFIDPATGAAVVSEVPPEEIGEELKRALPQEVQRALASWAEGNRTRPGQSAIFERNRYITPGRTFEQMAMAYDAVDDDVVSNVADTSEAIAFQKIMFESADPEVELLWNRIGKMLDLDSFVRQAWRELFLVSQFYAVGWWEMETVKLPGVANERKRRKSYDLYMPTALGFLDPLRVVPVKNGAFGEHSLAWVMAEGEAEALGDPESSDDPLIRQLFKGKYNPSEAEKKHLAKEHINPDRLMLLNPDMVWRHTLTKGTYERWAKLRMKPVFPLLDLKTQLRSMDRSYLLAAMNFIVLVTRGTDQLPANRAEVEGTTYMMRSQSRTPVIVSDHRIRIEIITPDMSNVLDKDKWMVLDERILMKLWGMFQLPSGTSNRETSVTLGKVIARGIANRRHMLKRAMERHIVDAVVNHPRNADLDLGEASIEFAPRRMELEYDASLVTMVQELRDRGDLSRETVLNEFNFDQDLEAQRRKVEDAKYKDVFKPVNVPFDSPDKTTPGGAGRKGGRPAGKPEEETKPAGSEEEK